MANIDFSKLENMFKSSSNFSLSAQQYEKIVGRKMPKNKYYLTKKSALATFARTRGFTVVVQEETIRTISFEKI